MAAPLLYDAGSAVPGISPYDALQVLPYGADRQLWLANRRRGIGGSDVSTLVGLNQYMSRYELWEDKTGRLPIVDEPSEPAEMGILLEPVVRDRFASVLGVQVRVSGMLQSQRWPWMFANPDGLCSDGNGYEGKTCSLWKAHEWGSADEPLVPDHAELQAQWCMAVTGLPGWHVACLIGGQRNVYRFVARDDELIADLVAISGDFWQEHVEADVAPAVDGSGSITELLNNRFSMPDPSLTAEIDPEDWARLAKARDVADTNLKAAQLSAAEVRNQIRQLMGTAERLRVGDGNTVATWKKVNKFAVAKFRTAHPDLASKYLHQIDAIDQSRVAAEHPDIYREFCVRELRFTD
jgi:putative phage-type endonuclease